MDVSSLIAQAAQLYNEHVNPTVLISCLVAALCLAIVARMLDVALMARILGYDIMNYRLPNLLRRITFRKPLVISDPDIISEGKPVVHRATVTSHDLDLMWHMNNARYLREADIARFIFLHASGVFHAGWNNQMYWVTAAQTIRYRRELRAGTRYKIVSRCVGYDEKAIFIEHLFVVPNRKTGEDDVHAMLFVREGVAVSKKIKETQQAIADAPVSHIMFDILKWDRKAVPATKKPPQDVADWAETLHASYARVIPGGHHHHHHGHHHGHHHHHHHEKPATTNASDPNPKHHPVGEHEHEHEHGDAAAQQSVFATKKKSQ